VRHIVIVAPFQVTPECRFVAEGQGSVVRFALERLDAGRDVRQMVVVQDDLLVEGGELPRVESSREHLQYVFGTATSFRSGGKKKFFVRGRIDVDTTHASLPATPKRAKDGALRQWGPHETSTPNNSFEICRHRADENAVERARHRPPGRRVGRRRSSTSPRRDKAPARTSVSPRSGPRDSRMSRTVR